MLNCSPRCTGFIINGAVAQLGEHKAGSLGVRGSSPLTSTIVIGCALLIASDVGVPQPGVPRLAFLDYIAYLRRCTAQRFRARVRTVLQ